MLSEEQPIDRPESHKYFSYSEAAAAVYGGVGGLLLAEGVVLHTDPALRGLEHQLGATKTDLTAARQIRITARHDAPAGTGAFLRKYIANDQLQARSLETQITSRKQLDTASVEMYEASMTGLVGGALLFAVAVGAIRHHLWKRRVKEYDSMRDSPKRQLVQAYNEWLGELSTTDVNNN